MTCKLELYSDSLLSLLDIVCGVCVCVFVCVCVVTLGQFSYAFCVNDAVDIGLHDEEHLLGCLFIYGRLSIVCIRPLITWLHAPLISTST